MQNILHYKSNLNIQYQVLHTKNFHCFQPIDNKRDQFRKYLEATGVIEVLSKSITKLMESPDKIESPVEFIRENMGLSQKEQNQLEFLKEEVEAYKKQVNDLKKEIAGLKLERQEAENAIPKETVQDVTAKVEAVAETQNDQHNDVETKKTEDAEPTPVLANGKTTDDVQKVDIANDVKPEAAPVEVTEGKIEPKPEDINTEEKPAGDASEANDK